MKRKIISVMLAVCLVVSAMASFSFAGEKVTYTEAKDKTENFILSKLTEPKFGDEWFFIGLARSGAKIPSAVKDAYYKDVEKTLKLCKGELHRRKYTEYSRLSLALTAIGKDPRNVAGYNLHKKLADFENVKWQGINGPIWALIALDAGDYTIPTVKDVKTQTTRDRLIKEILDAELAGGGFALSGTKADADMTGMALQALAKYKTRKDVKPVIDRAINVLSEMQDSEGGFGSWGTAASESCDQVIVALSALGIDADKDKRFVKNGNSVLDALLTYYVPETGGFRHVNKATDGYKPELNMMATEQGFYTLTAYDRFKNGKKSLYDMTDLNKVTRPSKAVITSAKSTKSKTAYVKWRAVKGAKGYQISYKTKTGKSRYIYTTRTSRTITKLSKGRTYEIKVRAYKTTNTGKKVYGYYSNVRKVKVK